ncbi:MAG: hypothetical protein ACRED2_08840 [Methylocella sp.]
MRGYSLSTARPKAAAAAPESGIAAACRPGSRIGHADLYDNMQTSDQLTIALRTPSNYDPTRAYPLLVVYPPAGFNRRQSETFYGLTTEATRRGRLHHVDLETGGAGNGADQVKPARLNERVTGGGLRVRG